MIFYQTPDTSKYWVETRPDWVQRTRSGKEHRFKRGIALCPNSPWRQKYLEYLEELVEMGADGLYFDEYPMRVAGASKHPCFPRA